MKRDPGIYVTVYFCFAFWLYQSIGEGSLFTDLQIDILFFTFEFYRVLILNP